MRALTIAPGVTGSLRVEDVPDPVPGANDLLVEALALGVCGTDREIADGEYGWAPPGRDRLILGHESLGRVREAPEGSGFTAGDLVVGIVRRPDPEPCGACAHGEFDMCRNGQYTERGIKEIDGFGSELWTIEKDYAVKLAPSLEEVGVLMEPATVLAKVWDQIERIGTRAWYGPRTVLVTGAGPIGLLAALFARRRDLEVHVFDRVADGPKPELVRDLGGTYHTGDVIEVAERIAPDIVVEATGVSEVAVAVMTTNGPAGIVCLTGVTPTGRPLRIDAGTLNRNIVLENDLIFGSVNANRRHYEQAATALDEADHDWLKRLITRRIPLERAHEAFEPGDDIKVVLDFRK